MSKDLKYKPEFVCFIEKEEDGSFSAILGMTGIPNKNYADWMLGLMKHAMDDMMTRTLGELQLEEMRAARKGPKKKNEEVKH